MGGADKISLSDAPREHGTRAEPGVGTPQWTCPSEEHFYDSPKPGVSSGASHSQHGSTDAGVSENMLAWTQHIHIFRTNAHTAGWVD